MILSPRLHQPHGASAIHPMLVRKCLDAAIRVDELMLHVLRCVIDGECVTSLPQD